MSDVSDLRKLAESTPSNKSASSPVPEPSLSDVQIVPDRPSSRPSSALDRLVDPRAMAVSQPVPILRAVSLAAPAVRLAMLMP